MLKRGYLQISFGWLFAIIAGIAILFLAIYLSVKILDIGGTSIDAKTTKEIEILFNPLETGFETGKTTTLVLPSGNRIINQCDNYGEFGTQKLSVSQKSFNKYKETGISSEFYNKYIFSEEFIEGKKFYLSSISFDMPFKIADLIFITTERYCFLDMPNEIEEDFFQENIITDEEECVDKDIKVCFSRYALDNEEECDIFVDYFEKYVEKDNERVYFEDSLMLGAIFSPKEIYECQVKRIMQRAEKIYLLYYDKSNFISNKCESNLGEDLIRLSNDARTFHDSRDLELVKQNSDILFEKNKWEDCLLF